MLDISQIMGLQVGYLLVVGQSSYDRDHKTYRFEISRDRLCMRAAGKHTGVAGGSEQSRGRVRK